MCFPSLPSSFPVSRYLSFVCSTFELYLLEIEIEIDFCQPQRLQVTSNNLHNIIIIIFFVPFIFKLATTTKKKTKNCCMQ